MVIFVLKVHSLVDVITNSSNELFVGKAQSKEEMINLIKEVYPEYLEEYKQIKNIDEVTVDELDTYFSFMCSPHMWPTSSKQQYPIPNGFTFEDVYEEDKVAWNGKKQYKLKREGYWEGYGFVTKANFKEIKKKLDPNKEMYFLFSYEENPKWEYQEKFSEFMDRFHLG